MSRWPRGEADIEQLIATNQLQQVVGGQANGTHLLEKAARTLTTAALIAAKDPDSATSSLTMQLVTAEPGYWHSKG